MTDQETLLHYSERLPLLLDQLYQTPTNPQAWNPFLSAIVEATRSRSARMLVMDREAQRVHYSTKFNIDDHQHLDYVNHYVNLCPWRPELALKTPGRLYNTFHEFSCKQDSFYRTEFFNDWARHLDIEHGLCGTVYTDSRYTVQLLIQRTGDQGAFPMSLTQQVNRLIPHVQQALHLNRAMVTQQQRHLSALYAAEKSFMPFVLLDAELRVIYACQRALALADSCSAFAIEDNQLQIRQPFLNREFQQNVMRAAEGGLVSGAPLIVHSEGRAAPIRLLVEGVGQAGSGPSFWVPEVAVAVYIQDPEEHLDIDQPLLSRLFGLTPAEARIGAGVALGQSLSALAEEGQVSIHTVRTQLKSLMAKTGVNRQSEVAGLVLKSSAVRGVNRGGAPIGVGF